MKHLSEKLKLSQIYTNHCIRVTGATNLTRANFSPKQIMSVSGHKSLESLAIYQKVANDEKMMMGMALTYSLLCPHDIAKITNTNQVSTPTPANPVIIQQKDPQPLLALPAPMPMTISTPDNSLLTINEQAITTKNKEYLQEVTEVAAQNAVIPMQSNDTTDTDFNLMEILQGFQNLDDDEILLKASQQAEITTTSVQKSTTTKSVIHKNINPPGNSPNFVNCKIGNININIHKQ